ncbi:hypothetical protein [Nocardia sp. NPDC023988]|uniref:hypothetical protein n=1 Tax=unclassified Nocardia TaxID=2637762 RepID=UPI0033D91173
MPLDRHGTLDTELGGSVLAEMTEEDLVAELHISTSGRGEFRVSLQSTCQPFIIPSDDTLTLAGRIVDLHAEHQTNLEDLWYRYSKLPKGQWNMESRFAYGASESRNSTAAVDNPHRARSSSAVRFRRFFGQSGSS